MDWNMVAAVAGTIAALAAVASAGAIVWQTRLTTKVQVILQLSSQWDSAEMRRNRSKAAEFLLGGSLSPWSNAVLNFFTTVAMFRKRKILDDEIIWSTFYWVMACYWSKAEPYIREIQETEGPKTWMGYCDLMPVLIKREGGKLPTTTKSSSS